MPDLLERTTPTSPTPTTSTAGAGLAPPTIPPVDAEPAPTGWPGRAKALVAVLIVAVLLGAIGTAVGFGSGEDLSGEVDELEVRLDRATTQRDDARAEVEQLEAQLADEQQRAETAEAATATAEAATAAAQADTQQIEDTVAELRSTIGSLTSERDDARAAIDGLEARVATLTTEIGDAQGIIEQLETDLVHGVVSGGHGIEVATPYPSDQSIHPIAIVAGAETGAIERELPSAWEPASIFETELVAEVGDSVRSQIEECPYNGPNIIRYRYATTVSLFSATSGQRIADVTLRGADPRECRQTEPWDLTELHGDEVTAAEVVGWLEQHVVTG